MTHDNGGDSYFSVLLTNRICERYFHGLGKTLFKHHKCLGHSAEYSEERWPELQMRRAYAYRVYLYSIFQERYCKNWRLHSQMLFRLSSPLNMRFLFNNN